MIGAAVHEDEPGIWLALAAVCLVVGILFREKRQPPTPPAGV